MRHGSHLDPPNRFEAVRQEADHEHLADGDELLEPPRREVQYVSDATRSIVSENRSPDVPFRYSLNPYRGCVHGCSYCYARPTHEYLGFNAGLDFETKIVVKHDAPELFTEFLRRPAWRPEPITFSGVTDCYQPAERQFRLTRACLQVAQDCGQPVTIITKNALVLRDLDLLQPLAARNLVHVFLSVTTRDEGLAREMEPRTSVPAARLRAVAELAAADVPVGVMVAPIIPGLNDCEAPAILAAARDAGAAAAGYVMLRLPLTVEPVFLEWLERTRPLQADRVRQRIREVRRGELSSSQWGERMVGSGPIAEQIGQMFQTFRRKLGLDRRLPPLSTEHFTPPPSPSGQRMLF